MLLKEQKIFDVYLMPITEKTDINFVTPQRLAELKSTKNKQALLQKQATWSLLLTALKHSFGLLEEQITFKKEQSGKWVNDKCGFSLSHTKEYACVAVSQKNCGVDIEQQDGFLKKDEQEKQRLYNYIFNQNDSKSADFLTLFTQKESLYKLNPQGGFAPKSIVAKNAKTVNLKNYGITLSFCGEYKNFAQIFYVNNGNIKKILDV